MARYIDADKLVAAIDSVIADDTDDIIFIRTGKWNRGAFIRTKRVKRMVEELIEDVEPVKRGKWEWENGDSYDSSGKRCSICGTMKDSVYSNYCPNCGAKMEAKEPEIEDCKTGQWLLFDGIRCSNCNYKLQTTGLPMVCPNCGAKMEGEKDE